MDSSAEEQAAARCGGAGPLDQVLRLVLWEATGQGRRGPLSWDLAKTWQRQQLWRKAPPAVGAAQPALQATAHTSGPTLDPSRAGRGPAEPPGSNLPQPAP